ncbi:DUF413 domain-containing protein [Thalassotalea crassostreae]|uniref:DUF413 domain-containing protein n=1 Tax=Thalassotalea crassostreae TaxID=1763536 RepID=UPI000838C204|nr:DUF413 domain-containing protein [Thalassotalea crassostreae]
MNTKIRKSNKRFYGDTMFARGLSRSGFFSKRESLELEEYGVTFVGLADGTLTPENEDEELFIREITANQPSQFYPAKLWQKYLNTLAKSKVHHGFAKSSGKTSQIEDLATD